MGEERPGVVAFSLFLFFLSLNEQKKMLTFFLCSPEPSLIDL